MVEIPGQHDALTDGAEAQEPEQDFAALLREDDQARASAVDRSGGLKQIDATVVAISADMVYLDIGYKTEGILPLAAFAANSPAIKPGDSVRVSVRGRNTEGYYELTRQHAAAPKDYASLEEAFEAGGTVAGTVSGAVKGGLTVDIGLRAFLPASRSGARDASEMEKLVGQQVRVRIVQLNLEGGESGRPDAVVDRRSVLEEQARADADARFAELTEGQIVHGTVRSLTDFGAFLDLDGADALLHISDIAWQRVGNPAEFVNPGDLLQVKVLKIDASSPDKRRIAVGLKQLQPHPWETVPDRFHLGDKVKGVVTRDSNFGAFVELAPGVEGLIHISELAWGKKVHKPSDVVNAGDQVEVVILAIDPEKQRIALGLKQALGDPFAEVMKTVHPGAVVEGPVSRLTTFGAFVEVAPGVEGLVHISEIVTDKRLHHPSEALRVGERVKAQVLAIDCDKRQLRLSIKQMVPTGLDEFLGEHVTGDLVTGRVIDVDHLSNTARIELGEGVLASCAVPPQDPTHPESPPATEGGPVDLSQLGSMLAARWKTDTSRGGGKAVPARTQGTESKLVEAGQVRSFRLRSINAEQKTIELELA